MGAAERSGVRGIPVVAFAGYSGSGKTTVIAALIPHLRRRGLRVAVVKHDGHSFLKWMVKGDFPEDTRAVAENALRGIFPERGPADPVL